MALVTMLLTASSCAEPNTPQGMATRSAAQTPPPNTSSRPSTPMPGVTLSSLGFMHGPAGFTVPAGLDLRDRVDQSNVVTLVVPAAQGQGLLDYLNASLPALGYTVTARSADSLIFEAPGWQGAFTMSDALAGLTLRRLAQ
ncbi:hypothetical protein SAMN05443377_10391 [Propionibacterium cyclohexanicum]|uniref:Uncharacterized protein n=2 Tax=Propionibacterium cyclohexanicum TaxID=64702 RepID=A0A1H9QHV9_9ACTN|nr:hypothetical protein SAMN05443377_10391 [Propionibacterium cyclohexanicum]